MFLSSNFLDDLPNVRFEGKHALPHVSTEKNNNNLMRNLAYCLLLFLKKELQVIFFHSLQGSM